MLSVIIPAYNEEKHIEVVVKKLKKEKFIDEILVVNDGSKDSTQRLAEKLTTTLSYGGNRGKGFAMRYGAEHAKGDYIIFFEGDDQLDVNDLRIMWKKLSSGDYDMVVGKRDFSVVPWPRKVNNVLTTLALFMATGWIVKDPLSGFMGFRRKRFLDLKLKEDRFNIESEINYKASRKHFARAYIDEHVKYHIKGNFKFNKLAWRQSFFIIAFLVKRVLRYGH